MRYILINQHIGHLFKDIVHDFAERGVETIILTGWMESGGKSINPNVQIWNGIQYNRKNSITRVFSWAIFTIQIWWHLMRCRGRYTKVLFASNPPFGPLLATLFKIPYAILVYDLYPDVLVSNGLLHANNSLVRWWGRRNQKIFDRAELVFTLSSAMGDAILNYFPDPSRGKNRIRVISNWADNEHIFPVKKSMNAFIITNRLEGKFIVMYSGNMGDTHPLESLVVVAEALKGQLEIVFLFIGEGAKRSMLERTVLEKKLPNVSFLPLQPFDQIHYSLSAADLNVIALDEYAAASSVPSKTYSALAAGSALLGITAPKSEVAKLILENQAGMSFQPAETIKMIEFILKMKEEPATLLKYKKNALKASKLFTPVNASLYFEEWAKSTNYKIPV